MAHDVFISYSSKDKPTADAVCAILEADCIRCWIAPRDVVHGMDWGETIIGAINGSRVMVLVFSGNANASPQIIREVERAVSKGIPVIPLRIEDIKPTAAMEYFLSTPHWLDAFNPPLERHLRYLAQVVQKILTGSPQKSLTSVLTKPPPSPEFVKEVLQSAPPLPTQDAATQKTAKWKNPKIWMVLATLGFMAFLLVAGWWFGSKAQKWANQETVAVQPHRVPAPVVEDGFLPLFNGRDLSGWTPMVSTGGDGDVHRVSTGGWVASEGELVCATGEDGWLRSDRQYRDFVLQLEFRLLSGGNSGVYIRHSGVGLNPGIEIQIIDSHRVPSGKDSILTGAIHGVVGSPRPPLRPTGQWNIMEIRCWGDDIDITLNGTRTASSNMSEEPKLRDRPRSGYLGISNWHGEANGMSFRNIRLKESLVAASVAAPSAVAPQPALPASSSPFVGIWSGQTINGKEEVIYTIKESSQNYDISSEYIASDGSSKSSAVWVITKSSSDRIDFQQKRAGEIFPGFLTVNGDVLTAVFRSGQTNLKRVQPAVVAPPSSR